MAAKVKKDDFTAYYNQTETVTLLKDNNNYKDDVTITHNGTNYQIQRGVPVRVPLFIKLILDESYRQQMAAESYSERLSREFHSKQSDFEG